MTNRPRPTPEAEHLAEQERLLEEIADQLAEREAEFAETGSAFARFRAEYLRRFAPLYAEHDRLEAEIARRIAADQDTAVAREKAAEAAARADESQQALDDDKASAGDTSETGPAPSDPDLKALYREAARKIHPDLSTDPAEKERRTALMAAVNAAYAAGDTATVQRILDSESSRPEAITGDDVAARLLRVIRKIAQVRGRFAELAELNEALRTDPIFVLFEQCRARWEAGHDALAEDEAALRERLASAHARLSALVIAEGKPPGRAGA